MVGFEVSWSFCRHFSGPLTEREVVETVISFLKAQCAIRGEVNKPLCTNESAFSTIPLNHCPLHCVCLAAVAHVHGGLQRSECAGSRESQLLKDEPGLQQRDKRRSVIFMTLRRATLTLCQSASTKQSLRTEYRALTVGLRMTSWVLRSDRMYADGNVALACFQSPASAQRQQDSCQFLFTVDCWSRQSSCFYSAQVMLLALAFTKCPSTESCCWMKHLVALYYWQKNVFDNHLVP